VKSGQIAAMREADGVRISTTCARSPAPAPHGPHALARQGERREDLAVCRLGDAVAALAEPRDRKRFVHGEGGHVLPDRDVIAGLAYQVASDREMAGVA
jgi:hypothetical protein